MRSHLKNRAFGHSNAAVFDAVYDRHEWGRSDSSEVYSGPGTYEPSVSVYVDFVREFIETNHVRSIVEIGCGDFAIAKNYAGLVDDYVGVDVSAIVVRHNSDRFGTDTISFVHADASETAMERADLCIIRQVLQHLDNRAIAKLLHNARVHKYVLVTEHLPSPALEVAPNLNKRSGPDTRLQFDSGVFVELPPFNCPSEIVLSLPLDTVQRHAGEYLRTSLIRNVSAS